MECYKRRFAASHRAYHSWRSLLAVDTLHALLFLQLVEMQPLQEDWEVEEEER